MNKDQIILFLHLLGTDTIGHGERVGDAYLSHITKLDSALRDIVALIEQRFDDGECSPFSWVRENSLCLYCRSWNG